MAEARLLDVLRELKGNRITVHIDGNLKVAGMLDQVESDFIVLEDKFVVPIARIGYITKSESAL